MKKTLLFFVMLNVFQHPIVYAQNWIQKGQDIDGSMTGDYSGYSVSMPDANTLAIGATHNDDNGTSSGKVRIYEYNSSIWAQKGSDINGEAANDFFGFSISMPDPNTIAVGADRNDGSGSMSGHVRIYGWNGSIWEQRGQDINGESADDRSGYSLSMPDANTVAIGARFNGGTGTDAGHVRVYEWNGSVWAQKGADIDGESAGDGSGISVSMPDANTVAIGAFGNDDNGSASGHVRIYEWTGSIWIQKGADIDGEASGDYSGVSVYMSDANTVAIGANNNDDNGSVAGHVRIYTWNGSIWVQKGTDINGESAGDLSGTSLGMPDVNTIAIGSPYNDGNGSDSGHVRVYAWSGSLWVQKGIDIDGEAAGDESGTSLSMPDGNTIAIGAYLNDGNGSNAGHVRVYSFDTSVGTEDVSTTLDMTKIYPNPNTGSFTVAFGQLLNNATINVTDVLGKIIYTTIVSGDKHNVQLNQPKGIYFVSIQTEDGERTTMKLVIE